MPEEVGLREMPPLAVWTWESKFLTFLLEYLFPPFVETAYSRWAGVLVVFSFPFRGWH